MELGKAIQKIRTEAKLTQAQFSEFFGVSQQAVQKWESGQISPDLDKIIMISKHFDISLDALSLEKITGSLRKCQKPKPSSRSIKMFMIGSFIHPIC